MFDFLNYFFQFLRMSQLLIPTPYSLLHTPTTPPYFLFPTLCSLLPNPTPYSRFLFLLLLPTRYFLLPIPYSYSHFYSYFNPSSIIINKSTRNNLVGVVVGVGSRQQAVGSRESGVGSRE